MHAMRPFVRWQDAVAYIFFALLMIVASGITYIVPPSSWKAQGPAMPDVDVLALDGRAVYGGMGTGTCREVVMEIRSGRRVVVWRLRDGRAPVVVFILDGFSVSMEDYDLDGRVDYIETFSAGSKGIDEAFRKVEVCR